MRDGRLAQCYRGCLRYNQRVRPGRKGLRFSLQALVALYVLAAAAMPFAHHDFACHLKSSTHCGTCQVGTSGDSGSADPVIAAAILADAGRPGDLSPLFVESPALLPSSGRSPPATL